MNVIWAILIVFGGFAVLVFLASFLAMYAACGRADKKLSNLDKALNSSTYGEVKPQILAARNWLEAQKPEQVTITAYDGISLVGEWIPVKNPRGTLIMCHGWHGSPITDFGCSMEMYHDRGLNLLLIHQRAQGKSGGRFITFGVKERRDVHSWIQWHNERMGEDMPLLLAGISMGATTVLMACGEPFPKNVKGVIADCGFTSPEDIITSVVRSLHLPKWPIVPLMDLQARLWAGFGFREYSTVTALKNMHLPLFLAHGQGDTFVPWEMSQQNYDACPSEEKQLLLVPDAPHGLSFVRQPEKYKAMIDVLLEKTLK